jgi:uncharacterized protein with NRDE domain
VVGGRDLERGGTWLGVRPDGRFALVTNQRSPTGNRPGLASRGQLVMELLAQPDVPAMRRRLGDADGSRYNAFNLLFGDAESLWVGYGRRGQVAIELAEVEPGLHVLPNDRLDAPGHPKVARARALVAPMTELPWPALRPALWQALGDHERLPLAAVEEPPSGSLFSRELLRELSALCIHTPAYGTRSATVLSLAPGRVLDFETTDAPPCQGTPATALGLLA